MTRFDYEALIGLAGWDGLKVRHWKYSACGADHDRDINSAVVVLNAGLGMSLERKAAKVA